MTKKKVFNTASFLFVATLLLCCGDKQISLNKFGDPVVAKIADLKDRRSTDSLYAYLTSDVALHREEAALAFASIQDSIASEKIGALLVTEKNDRVRQACAFALGQTGGIVAREFLLKALEMPLSDSVTVVIREALGKNKFTHHFPPATGVAERSGNAWGAYRQALIGKGKDYVVQGYEYLGDSSAEVRIAAANFFSRSNFPLDTFKSIQLYALLSTTATTDASADVRMAAVLSLRKFPTDSTMVVLQNILDKEKDQRVRVNAIRALAAFPSEKAKSILQRSLQDDNVNVAIAASETLRPKINQTDVPAIIDIAKSLKVWRVQANVYEAALAAGKNEVLTQSIHESILNGKNPYQQAALITALQQAPESFDFVKDQLLKADTPVLRSSAASAIVAMNAHKRFSPDSKKQYADFYAEGMRTGDAAVIGTFAAALADTTLGYKNLVTDYTFLHEARKKLSLPRDNEALQPLEAAIAYFEGTKEAAPVVNDFNHPIDWQYVKTIPANQRVKIQTSKGDIVLRMLVEEAPGSVANFLQLADQKYFNKKFFHRVVPNFVVQAGCNRGDGWGSEDYSIRSEFSKRKYATGSVGMASAGKDTEGTQWFITHSPTPHLDGRYTIFAIVESGMDVVNQIGVGDQIIAVDKIL